MLVGACMVLCYLLSFFAVGNGAWSDSLLSSVNQMSVERGIIMWQKRLRNGGTPHCKF